MIMKNEFYTLTPFNDTLLIAPVLAWDHRIASLLFKDVNDMRSRYYRNRHWAILTDCRNWELGTPEIEKMLLQVSVSDLTAGLTHHAVVAGPSEIKKWQLSKGIREEKHFESRIFETLADGKSWLASAGYHMRPVQAASSEAG